jgi:hypothetical protein
LHTRNRRKGIIIYMLKSTAMRPIFFVLLSLFLIACFTVSRPAGHAAVEEQPRAETAVTALTVEENGSYIAYMPVVSTQQWLTNCRYGVGNKSNQVAKKWIDYLGAGHYINFEPQFYGPPTPDSVELLPQIRIRQDRKDGQFLNSYTIDPPLTMESGGLGALLDLYPASTWLAGNEPDVDNSAQDRIYPELYAEGYHEVYTYIKQHDPEAQVAIAGLSMMTPGRLQYLDKVWNAYANKYGEPMPVDVWNMHLYILAEINPQTGEYADGKVALGTDPSLAKKEAVGSQAEQQKQCPSNDVYCRAEHDDMSIFKEQIVAMRNWMKAHGQQNRPLIISEFSLLYPFVDYDDPIHPTECFLMDEYGKCFTEPRVTSFLHKTMDYLEQARDTNLGYPADDYHLVQQWTWYSLKADYATAGDSSNLMADNYANAPLWTDAGLTEVGRAFRDRARTSERTVNLIAGNAPTVQKTSTGSLTSVDISASFYNNGSAGILDSFKVTFYEDAALSKVIGETEINPHISGIVNGCSWDHPTDWASVTWNVPVGTHTFWAKIDSSNAISDETNEGDNVTSGKVTIN